MQPASDRFRIAIDRAKKEKRSSINQLSQALRAEGIAGASYGSVRNYYHGKSRPPAPLLEAAAPILGVRPEWLARGEGAPTEPEQRQHEKDAETPEWLLAAVSAEFPVYEFAPEWARELVKQAQRECLTFVTFSPADDALNFRFGALESTTHDAIDEELAGRLGRVLAGPLATLEIDPTRLSPVQLGDYILHVAQAVRVLFGADTIPWGTPIAPRSMLDYE